jgi:hypothetical protein
VISENFRIGLRSVCAEGRVKPGVHLEEIVKAIAVGEFPDWCRGR